MFRNGFSGACKKWLALPAASGGVRAGRTESVRETIDSVLCSVPAAARTRPPRLAPTTRRRLVDSRRLPTLGARQHSPHSPTAPDATDMEYKYWWWLAALGALLALAAAQPSAPELHEHEHELIVRSARGTRNRESCRYVRGSWSECDPKTNVRSRTLTLKKGDPASCERAKTIQKKCKKACRYEKSSWSECSPNGEMSRTDMLKANSDPTCDASRRVTKKCNKNKQVKATKDKGRRNRQ
ncbi:uncharacterized protein LOC123668929 [Melitaea cinxia]|uniref:uncharacterized protein LOC123668929 n=1 Tax=Melitaea cinxia TaxID=113334 RepID=UPI001E2731EF|nr:uncharacterized protein LOC123668929 [Melitaea cinxia]